MITDLNNVAESINYKLSSQPMSTDKLCTLITDGIYNSGKNNKIRNKPIGDEQVIPNHENCTSKNYKAIADANFKMYEHSLLGGADPQVYLEYLKIWLHAEEQAQVHTKKEFDVKVNDNWVTKINSDAKKMWQSIDWKGKHVEPQTKTLSEDTINNYFVKIYNSDKNISAPNVSHVSEQIHNYTCSKPEMDEDPTLEELNDAIVELGTGVSIDGISPEVFKILPNNIRQLIVLMMKKVFNSNYPELWEKQLLLAFPKKGHCISEPKLRGIGIGPGLSRIFDIMMNKRFCSWYKPNVEQAGFRENQGSLLQIFVIYVLLDLAVMTNQDMFIIYMDYEKAFDFVNRALLLKKMMEKGIGHKFAKTVFHTYENTSYLPKLSNKYTGAEIETDYGVTQGKTSSANYFSLYVSDMAESTRSSQNSEENTYIVQLADDTALLGNDLHSLITRFRSVLDYSSKNHLSANMDKTKYLHLSTNPMSDTILIDNKTTLESSGKGGYKYLGITMIQSKYIYDHIMKNINEKKGNVVKYYHWLDNNKYVPIKIKLLVLYSCVLPTILYGAETWWELDKVKDVILEIERSALKRCLCVKKSTPTDLLYVELNRPDIIACLKDRQHKFFTKINSLSCDEALVKTIIGRCDGTNMIRYYRNLHNQHRKINVTERMTRLQSSTSTMTTRYMNITEGKYASHVYDFHINEVHRTLLTRWRLSCFDLAIESGRYNNTRVDQRLCSSCNVVEDEHHVLFVCGRYTNIRNQFTALLSNCLCVRDILQPANSEMAKLAGKYIKLIEATRKDVMIV